MAYIKIIRPLNCCFAALTALFGAAYMQSFASLDISVLYVMLSVFAIAGAGYVINDYFDYEIDKVNRPDRVLPAGLISPKTVFIYSCVLSLIGLICAGLTMNTLCIVIAGINANLLYFYAKKYKKVFLFGNIVVAWNTCSTFIYGAVLTGNIRNVLPLVIISFLYTIIREWVKSIEDIEGDRMQGVKSIATLFSRQNAINLLKVPYFLLFSSVILLYLYDLYTIDIFILIICIAIVPIYFWFRSIKHKPEKENIHKVQTYMKLSMLCILIIFIINDVIKNRL
jgi:geranylgeranylglycerol-phosphate geranylgeranyltransferase